MGLCSQQLNIAFVYYSTAITDIVLPTEDLSYVWKMQFWNQRIWFLFTWMCQEVTVVAEDISQTFWSQSLKHETFTVYDLSSGLGAAWPYDPFLTVCCGAHLWSLDPLMEHFNCFLLALLPTKVGFFTFLVLPHLHVTILLNFFFRLWLCHDFIRVGAFVILHHSICWIKLLLTTVREVCLPGLCALASTRFEAMPLQRN